jgi:hypothetical protein
MPRLSLGVRRVRRWEQLRDASRPSIVPSFVRILDDYIEAHYASRAEESVAQFQV